MCGIYARLRAVWSWGSIVQEYRWYAGCSWDGNWWHSLIFQLDGLANWCGRSRSTYLWWLWGLLGNWPFRLPLQRGQHIANLWFLSRWKGHLWSWWGIWDTWGRITLLARCCRRSVATWWWASFLPTSFVVLAKFLRKCLPRVANLFRGTVPPTYK